MLCVKNVKNITQISLNVKCQKPLPLPQHDIVRYVADGFKESQIRISIWAVSGCHSEVLFVRKFKINCEGFFIGSDIEIIVSIFFICN